MKQTTDKKDDAVLGDLSFRINGIHPDSISFKRLNTYLKEIANYLGSEKNLHLVGITKKCVHLSLAVDSPKARLAIHNRISNPPNAAQESRLKILKLLSEDKADAEVLYGERKVVSLDGRRYANEPIQRLPRGHVTFKGELIKIGGVDDSVPFELVEYATGDRIKGNVSKNVARQMAAKLFSYIAVSGEAGWERHSSDTQWRVERFVATGFEPLDNRPLSETFGTLFRLSDPDAPDAIERLNELRSDN